MMRNRWLFIGILVWIVFSVCWPVSGQSPRERIKTITDYVVYYGEGRASELAGYDLAIVQPETLTESEIADLHQADTLVVAYISLGEAEPDRSWFSEVEADWLLGENADWGSYYVDVNQIGWQDLILRTAGEILAQGYDGLFLDTVDTAEMYPETTPGMIALIQRLRREYPNILLIQNRGFSLLEAVFDEIDAVKFEDLSTTYDFETQTYQQIEPDTSTIQTLLDWRSRTGGVVLALDYAAPSDRAAAERAVEIARGYGFVPSVSIISLDEIPDYGIAACTPTPADMEGPYYIEGAPEKNRLYPEGTPGERLIISGTVYAADCTPLTGATVDVWQANASGEYDFSDQFIGRGRVISDENGRYTFETILPGRYEPRPLHIHFKISHPEAATLTTQLYFAGRDNSTTPPDLTIPLTRDGAALQGTFDLVLANP